MQEAKTKKVRRPLIVCHTNTNSHKHFDNPLQPVAESEHDAAHCSGLGSSKYQDNKQISIDTWHLALNQQNNSIYEFI